MNLIKSLMFGASVLAASPLHAASGEGIFAEFTTSMGSFTCRLDYAIAPKAVANFIGLATGQRAWLDLPTGTARTNAFYDGLTFHRVIPGFMIQGGSPNGQGTDGPGYAFIDEFNASARFTGTGVLAMANSGPDSNGSQYFITVAPTPHLNDVHTIFGHVTSGTNVVIAISQVATDPSNNRPYTNVVVERVRIRRVGAAAEAFDIHAQDLPIVTNIAPAAAPNGTNINVTFANRAFADNRLVLIRETIDIWMNVGNSGCPLDILIRRALDTERNVFPNGLAEQKGFLWNKADCGTQFLKRNPFDWDSIDEHCVRRRIVQPWNELHERRFT